ncbi:DUF2306 domain-containing protein [Solimicrobium silvestre]|uniref:DUF2306 domain-containing protein n=1 Tax=Solimicrobium silvestre TaxID=2099400 RepID=A0A2S9H4V0_9BURK|nr:DUF2306 domain-containing protein [Solimicrobium silvestre]PRC95015.1 hypothetical protein S2091_0210 [Solimicrobium silvestre]
MALDIGIIGWVHTIACIIALISGFILLWKLKGGDVHKRLGGNYVIASVIANITALAIYKIGGFTLFHILALATLISLIIAFVSARWKIPGQFWLRVHLTAIIFSYYQLVGGLINEVFLRVPGLKEKTAAISNFQGLALVFFLMLIAYFGGKTSRSLIQATSVRPRANINHPKISGL